MRAVAVTTANVHDLNKAEEVLQGDPGDVYARHGLRSASF